MTLDRFGVENWTAGTETRGAVDVEDWREISWLHGVGDSWLGRAILKGRKRSHHQSLWSFSIEGLLLW